MGAIKFNKPQNNKGQTKIKKEELGVFHLFMPMNRHISFSSFDFVETLKVWHKGVLVLQQLLGEIFKIAPSMIPLLLLFKVWKSLEEVILLGLETRVLEIVERGMISRDGLDSRALILAIIARLLFVMCTSLTELWRTDTESRIRNRVKLYYDEFLLMARLRVDLPSLQDNRSNFGEHLSSDVPWFAFNTLLQLGTGLVAVISQLGFMLHLFRSGGYGLIFALLCVVKPLIMSFSYENIWTMRECSDVSEPLRKHNSKSNEAHVVEATNTDYIRMQSLKSLDNESFRMDILSGNLVEYIIGEFRKARIGLGETSTDCAEAQYDRKQPPTITLVASFVGDFPLLYYAAITLIKPSSMSLSTLATLQKSTSNLRWLFSTISHYAKGLQSAIGQVQHLYDLKSSIQTIKDGELSYPTEKKSDKGMAFDLRNVCFSYPGSKEDTKALNNVSFQIEPGEFVVVVGANGSGKSTFVKLLTRLYDVNDGSVLVDGEDIRRYKLADYRQHIAVLTQEHILFPLSIEENIGLGCPEAREKFDVIAEALSMGGASEVVKKLKDGIKTVLDPYSERYGVDVNEEDEMELAAELNKITKTEVSGGERQRLVASRIFMRFYSNKIKFVAVDEPSSALDPEGELELFNNLREARAGKTMIFVTHRFGYLTKYADKILCMKEGQVVETGSHTELMALEGEYCKMYNIQAKPFES